MKDSETGNPFLDARRQRLQTIRKLLIGIGEIEFKRAIGMVMLNFGLSQEKAREHVACVVNNDDSFSVFENVIQFVGERKEARKAADGQKPDAMRNML